MSEAKPDQLTVPLPKNSDDGLGINELKTKLNAELNSRGLRAEILPKDKPFPDFPEGVVKTKDWPTFATP